MDIYLVISWSARENIHKRTRTYKDTDRFKHLQPTNEGGKGPKHAAPMPKATMERRMQVSFLRSKNLC